MRTTLIQSLRWPSLLDINIKIKLTDIEGMPSFQCYLGWSHSIGCLKGICTQIHRHQLGEVQFIVHHIKDALHSVFFLTYWLTYRRGKPTPQVHRISSPFYVPMSTIDHNVCYLFWKNVVSMNPWIFSNIFVRDTLHFVTHKGAHQYSAMCVLYAPKICSITCVYAFSKWKYRREN